jgi:hypothetical protein
MLRDTPRGLKPGGFLGQPAFWRAYPPTELSAPVFDGDGGVVVAVERHPAAACDPPVGQGEPFKCRSTAGTDLGRSPWVYQDDHPTGACSLGVQPLHEVAPSGVQNALGEGAMHHARDGEVFQRDPIIPVHQIVRQLVQVVFALIPNPLVLPLQHHDRLASVLPTLRSSRNPTLADAQLPLGVAIEPGMGDLFPITGGNQACQAHINPYVFVGRRQRRRRIDHTRKAGEPLSGLLADAEGLDLAFQRTMPAHRDPPNARQLEPPAGERKAVAVLLKAERAPAGTALESRVTGRFARLEPPEKGLEGLLQSVDHELQDVAMDVFRPGVGGLALLHPAQLGVFANRFAPLLVGRLALSKTVVVEEAAGLQRGVQQTSLGTAGIEAIAKGFADHRRDDMV